MAMLVAVFRFGRLMTAREFLEEMQRHKATDKSDCSDGNIEELAGIVREGLREKLEGNETEQETCGESKYEMETIFRLEGK
jgi:hypothetical protein